MSKIIITSPEKKIDKVQIDLFQNNFNLTLPNNYKFFLLKYNGGLVIENELIRLFLSIAHGQKIEDEIDTHQISEQNIPQGFLPIALDYSDNPITINLNEGEDYCKIFLFELDFEGEGFIIANSLEELLGVNSIDEL